MFPKFLMFAIIGLVMLSVAMVHGGIYDTIIGYYCRAGCPINYSPVCTYDQDNIFLEFNNLCEFEAKKCIDGLDSSNTYNGPLDCKTGNPL